MDEHRRINFLIKFAENLYTEEEHQEFINWIRNCPLDEVDSMIDMYEGIADQNAIKDTSDQVLKNKLEAMLDALDLEEKAVKVLYFHNYYKLAAAAILILLLSSLYLFIHRASPESIQAKIEKPKTTDVPPGSNIAVLTLADGSKILLDKALKGEIAQQADIVIRKIGQDHLVYKSTPFPKKSYPYKVLFNVISTPRGGEYQINLPDGSRVWLNAESSLKYPVLFTGNERRVQLVGEAYFEIAHNRSKPFKVESGKQVVEVFGTHFNINSYTNEPVIKTTLLEGSVKVTQTETQRSESLKPGQEANTTKNGSVLLSVADISQAISWKNGNFVFNDMDLVNIMRQLERWYDVQVDYSSIPQTRYNGVISRNVNLSRVLAMLEVTGKLKFELKGKRIRVTK